MVWLPLVGAALLVVARAAIPRADPVEALVVGILVLGTAMSGSLVASRRPTNPCGWLLTSGALFLAAGTATLSYAKASVDEDRGWPFTEAVAWLASWLTIPGFVCLGFLILLYPSGTLVSRRWSWVAFGGIVGVTGLSVSAALQPGPWSALSALDNPLGVDAAGLLKTTETISSFVLVLFAAASLASLVIRFRRATGAIRQQIKWLLYAACMTAATLLFAGAASGVVNELSFYLATVGLLAIPAAVAIGILGHDLLDLDAVINRTVVYAMLTLGVAAVYVLVAAGFGTVIDETVPVGVSLVATAAVAVLLVPMRGGLQHVVNRAMFGARSDPYAALTGLSRELAAARPAAEVLPGVAETVGRSLRLSQVQLEVRRGDEFEPIAQYGASGSGDERVFPLTHQGELVGRLTVSTLPGESLTKRDIGLLEDLGLHIAGLVHGRRLTQDLDRSRTALINSRVDERRRLRRDLHDGLGPELAGVTFGLAAVRNVLREDPDRAEALLGHLEAQTRDAVGQVRGLVEGLAPPDLEEAGLVEAIRAGGARIGFGTSLRCVLSIETEDLPVLPAAAELAAYRVAMEALANVARHAAANAAVVRLSLNEALHLEIDDDGVGMPMGFVAGVGVTSMRERALEVGGRLVIERRPPGGTRVACVLPVTGVEG